MGSKVFLFLICLLFLFTRLYKITEIPPSVYWDEASIGYNAYSIIQSGKDEWGEFFPLHFRAFGEFKLPVYIYTVSLFIKFLGLNEFTIRVPAMLFSLVVIILTYLISKQLFKSKVVALSSSFLVVISPWFFIFSRTGYEATAGLAFYLLGILFFLRSKDRKYLLIISTLSFILSLYSYNSFRIIIPLTIPILILTALQDKFIRYKVGIISLFLLAISFIPIWRLYKYDNGLIRLEALKVHSVPSFINNYFSHFNPIFLFISGDMNLRSQQAGFGQLYIIELPFILLGLLYLFQSKDLKKYIPLILAILAPIPAALTIESPHALRSISIVPFIAIISSLGIESIVKRFGKKVFILIIIVFCLFFALYFNSFINNYSEISSEHWQYGYKQIYKTQLNEWSKADHIIVSDRFAQPYIFALYYLKYDPNKFWQSVERNNVDKWGFSTVSKIGKFEFRKIDQSVKSLKNTLVYSTEEDKLENIDPIKKINFLNNKTAFWIYYLP